jgi:hypothetical protein
MVFGPPEEGAPARNGYVSWSRGRPGEEPATYILNDIPDVMTLKDADVAQAQKALTKGTILRVRVGILEE